MTLDRSIKYTFGADGSFLWLFLTFSLQILFTVAPFPLRMPHNWVDASFRCTVAAAARVKVVCVQVRSFAGNRPRRGAQPVSGGAQLGRFFFSFAPARARLHPQPLITRCKAKYVRSATTG